MTDVGWVRVEPDAPFWIPCPATLIYRRDPALPPLPMNVGVWKSAGKRAVRLRELAGGGDQAGIRRPEVSEVTTVNLGIGLRVLRYEADGGVLGYAFRSERFEADLQILVGCASMILLTTAFGEIDDFVRRLAIHVGPAA
jgi:hypothetical protein